MTYRTVDNRYGFNRGQTKYRLRQDGRETVPFTDIEAWVSTGNNYGVMGEGDPHSCADQEAY